MNPTDYNAPEAGKIVQTAQGYAAFVPSPLPPAIVYDNDLVLALSQADAALSELAGLGRTLPNPHLLIGSYVRREAVLSSRIEGTHSDLSDLLLDEIDSSNSRAEDEDLREVRNYMVALEHGIARLAELPLSLRLIREIHGKLLDGVRGNSATPGEFRRSQNWIGRPGSTLATAAYVPPPPDVLMECLGAWEDFAHVKGTLPDLIQCALLHEQFEAIHPFLDGNGRVGRLLITLFLMERGRLSQPLLYLSDYIEANREGYYDALQRIRTHGDWRGWLLYFLDGVTVTARNGVGQASALLALRERMNAIFSERPRALPLVDALFLNPYVTAVKVQQTLCIADPTARLLISFLEEKSVLEEVTGRSWGKVWVARPILNALAQRS